MSLPPFATTLFEVLHRVVQAVTGPFLSPGSLFSFLSLGVALAVSVAFLVVRRKRKLALRLRALWRALFPKRIWRHASTRADIGYWLLNTFVTVSLIGWALFSKDAIRDWTSAGLVHLFGASSVSLPAWIGGPLLTLALFLAYEFAYWLDHYLMHRIGWLWEFHRVHHTAEVLTPLTAARMHPVDSLIFANICAVIIGPVHGLMSYVLGSGAHETLISGTNIILVVFLCLTIHLQHSHIRLTITGFWGRIIFSPAHHHIHHSDDPRHYNTNLGSCLAIWDWMFGTLVMPTANQRLRFGTGAAQEDPHSASGGLIHPFVQSARILLRPLHGLIRRPVAPPAEIENA
jgi:sterol desaturase/sphingolipid hydroxylase (fatty acid hydroxylase superfamily)